MLYGSNEIIIDQILIVMITNLIDHGRLVKYFFCFINCLQIFILMQNYLKADPTICYFQRFLKPNQMM